MKIELFNLRLRLELSLTRLVTVEGINSLVEDNADKRSSSHILLWDFDDIPLRDIEDDLLMIQHFWQLPDIHIVSSSPNHYHAYCFALNPLPVVLNILSSTKTICWTYFRLGVIRGYWTLRISPKKHDFEYIKTLDSPYPENIDVINKLSIVKYSTKEE